MNELFACVCGMDKFDEARRGMSFPKLGKTHAKRLRTPSSGDGSDEVRRKQMLKTTVVLLDLLYVFYLNGLLLQQACNKC